MDIIGMQALKGRNGKENCAPSGLFRSFAWTQGVALGYSILARWAKYHPAMLHLLPGMGATSLMYAGPWRNSAGISFSDWPTEDPRLAGDFSLADLARVVINRQNIRDGDAVGGSSMGGMVALEIAKQVPVSAVLLIGSAREPGEIRPLLRQLAPYVGLAPIPLAQVLAGKSGGEVGKMFEAVPADFIRHSCVALARWEGVGELACPVHRLHGECDWVIPCPKSGATVVKGAGHLVGMTEAQVCAEWVQDCLCRANGPK